MSKYHFLFFIVFFAAITAFRFGIWETIQNLVLAIFVSFILAILVMAFSAIAMWLFGRDRRDQ